MIIFSSICNSKRLAVGLCPDPLRELRTLPRAPSSRGGCREWKVGEGGKGTVKREWSGWGWGGGVTGKGCAVVKIFLKSTGLLVGYCTV